jgi:hypothetical protein
MIVLGIEVLEDVVPRQLAGFSVGSRRQLGLVITWCGVVWQPERRVFTRRDPYAIRKCKNNTNVNSKATPAGEYVRYRQLL